jgi:hypothetical protein
MSDEIELIHTMSTRRLFCERTHPHIRPIRSATMRAKVTSSVRMSTDEMQLTAVTILFSTRWRGHEHGTDSKQEETARQSPT